MNADELQPILHAYREQVEKAWSEDTCHHDYDGSAGSPKGQCGVTSAWLQESLLEDHGIEADCVYGALYNPRALLDQRHIWVNVGDFVMDLTADQYGEAPVICGTYQEIAVDGLQYSPRLRLVRIVDDPILPRLALLKAALS